MITPLQGLLIVSIGWEGAQSGRARVGGLLGGRGQEGRRQGSEAGISGTLLARQWLGSAD